MVKVQEKEVQDLVFLKVDVRKVVVKMKKAYSGFIKVRSGTGTEKSKVFVKGYASTINKPDLYNYLKMPNGKTRTFKSIFTKKCIDDMQNQVMHKSIFVDGMHETATNLGIINLAEKYGFSDDDKHDFKSALKMKRMPLAKVTEFNIDDNGLILGTETNPNFALVDSEHKNYYEAMTGSLLDGYLKGYSINFDPIKFVSETDDNGNVLDFIDKVNLYGISYTDNPALADNQFTDVCMRSLGNFMKVRNVNETEDNVAEPKPPEPKPEVKPIVPEQKPATDINVEVERRVQEELKKKEIESEQKSMSEQMVELKQQMSELRKSPETTTQAQSIIQPQDKYGNAVQTPTGSIDQGQLRDKLNEITAKHNDWIAEINKPTPNIKDWARNVGYSGTPMGGFGEMIQLQAQQRSYAQQKPGESQDAYNMRMALIQNNSSDHMVVKRPMVQ